MTGLPDNGFRRIYRYDYTRQGSRQLGDLLFEGIGPVANAKVRGDFTADQYAMKQLFEKRQRDGNPLPPGTYFLLPDDVRILGGPFAIEHTPDKLLLGVSEPVASQPVT